MIAGPKTRLLGLMVLLLALGLAAPVRAGAAGEARKPAGQVEQSARKPDKKAEKPAKKPDKSAKKPDKKADKAKKPDKSTKKPDKAKKPDKKAEKPAKKPDKSAKKPERSESRKHGKERRKAPSSELAPQDSCLGFQQGDEGPTVYYRALSQLPDLHAFPKETRRWTMSALVKMGKDAVLVDGLAFRRKGEAWVWDGMKALSSGGAVRVASLSEAGVEPDSCAHSPDKWLVGLAGMIKREQWDELLLDSTWKRNPEAHSLVDQIKTDLKACGRDRYLNNLQRLPKFGLLSPSLWFLLLKLETGSDKKADYVELGLVPVKGQFRVASLRVVCTD